jgi:hypothetical protein
MGISVLDYYLEGTAVVLGNAVETALSRGFGPGRADVVLLSAVHIFHTFTFRVRCRIVNDPVSRVQLLGVVREP